MSQEIIKRTQNLLGKYVTKPPLSEKLLGKPPFRYLHDIINVVINDHGFLKGLLTDDELNSENIKDKDAKIAFLQKVIDATSIATQENLDVRPSKIVAGHDADKTNLLLQAIAKGIAKKIDSTEAVERVLSGGKPQKADKTKAAVKSKDSRTRVGSQGKDKKEGAKPKPSDAKLKKKEKEDKGTKKISKSRAGSSRTELREEGKENDPPRTTEVDSQPISNGHIPEEEIPIALRPKSGRLRSEDEEIGEDPMVVEGFQGAQGIPKSEDEDEGLALVDEVDLTGELALDLGEGNADNEGPNSLLQLNGDQNLDLDGDETEPRLNRQIEPDPLILKAMNRGENILNEDDGINPRDSGVGSLESPKPNARVESLPNAAQSKSPRPIAESPSSPVPVPPTPGPGMRPISAYHPDLKEDGIMQSPEDANKELEQIERPKTGMGIRPRTGRKSARPVSARPAPPKVRERKEIPQEEIPRPPTGKPVANVILDAESNGLGDDDDEVFTVGNAENVLDDELSSRPTTSDPNLEKNKQELLEGDQDAKGILVAQILETKKELEDDRREAFSPETPGHRRVPIEQAFPQDASKKKEKEMIQKDVEKLTSSIQALTRSVNPLAKMLDYLQEDLDSMQKELEMWTEENKTLTQTLKAEQSLTEQQEAPLKAQLEEMESAIFDQQDRISAVKSNIMRNDERIARLMAGINLNS